MDSDTLWMLVKIGITAGSLILLWIYKRRIMSILTDAIVGGDTKAYEEKTYVEIRDEMERKIDEVLK